MFFRAEGFKVALQPCGCAHDGASSRVKAPSFLLVLAAASGFLAVALGALGAHAMEEKWAALADKADAAKRTDVWRTAAHYHLAHAVALAAVALSAAPRRFSRAAICWVAGILLFSGSLYLLGFCGVAAMRGSPAPLRQIWTLATPAGGLLLLAGWISLLFPGRRD
jgi:uncharacterized membrane protein YgdD (TMEM256/DUF423 family)